MNSLLRSGALGGTASQDCVQHGCCTQAYRDVFTACPGKPYHPATFTITTSLAQERKIGRLPV